MPDRPDVRASNVRSLIVITAVVIVLVVAFAYTAGWLSPGRLTPSKIVDSLAPPGGPALGFKAQSRDRHVLHRQLRVQRGPARRSPGRSSLPPALIRSR